MPDSIVNGVLQQGPCCGIVALHLALAQVDYQRERVSTSYDQTILSVTSASISAILEMAKSKKYTTFGEMFSCDDMLSLSRDFLPASAHVTLDSCIGKNRRDFVEMMKNHFRNGGVALVPYDKDVDFRPCTNNGTCAHWALLVGMASVSLEGDFTGKKENGGTEEMIPSETDFVAARHGKSLKIAFWNVDDLLSSNEQLLDYDWDKLRRESRFDDHSLEPVIPVGGLDKGLKGKMIFIRI